MTLRISQKNNIGVNKMKDLAKLDILKTEGSKVIYKRSNGSIGVLTHNIEPSKTQNQFKDSTNVNTIIGKYLKAPNPAVFVKQGKGLYGDFSKAKDFQTSLNTILEAQAAFDSLDASIRAKFQNSPQQLLSFLDDPQNLEEAIKLKLVEKQIPKETNETTPVTTSETTT